MILVFLSPPKPPETHTLTSTQTTMLATVSTPQHLPLMLPCDDDFPILQYADDTLIFMQGDVNQL